MLSCICGFPIVRNTLPEGNLSAPGLFSESIKTISWQFSSASSSFTTGGEAGDWGRGDTAAS